MKSKKKKLIIYEMLSIIVTLLPLFILIIVNREHYIKSVSPAGLTISGILCIIFASLMVKDKLKTNDQRLLKFLIFFIFCYVFEPFLVDLKIISFMAFLGVLVNSLLFEWRIKELKKEIETESSAGIFAKKLSDNFVEGIRNSKKSGGENDNDK